MSEELIITNEDIELLKEMKDNCLKSTVYNDEKRLLKANALTKFLMLLQENQQLKEKKSNLEDVIWLLNHRTEKAIELINKAINPSSDYINYEYGAELFRIELIEILKGEE